MSSDKEVAHQKIYVNVMESIVTDEVNRQLQQLPDRVSKYIKRSEVETFALNRLPALYASSEKGFQHQRARARQELNEQIVQAVRQAFAAVQIDPIRLSQPIQLQGDDGGPDAVLQALRDWLQSPELTWKTALQKIQVLKRRGAAAASRQRAHAAAAAQESTPQPSGQRSQPSAPSDQAAAANSSTWRPGTYGSRLTWQPRKHHSESTGGFDDNHLL